MFGNILFLADFFFNVANYRSKLNLSGIKSSSHLRVDHCEPFYYLANYRELKQKKIIKKLKFNLNLSVVESSGHLRVDNCERWKIGLS